MFSRWLLGLVMSGLIYGCGSWPEAGTGGMAEHYLSHSRDQVYHRWPFLTDLPSQQFLKMRIDASGQYLTLLSHLGAKRCMPAKVWLAEQEWVMAQRDFEGALFEDADTHQRQLAAMNDFLKSKLDSHELSDFCTSVDSPMTKIKSDRVNAVASETVMRDTQPGLSSPITPFRLHFASMSSELLPGSRDALIMLSSYLLQHPEQKLRVIGHADSSGNKAHNLSLSIERAQAVLNYLIANGVQEGRVALEGQGDDKPLEDNVAVLGRSINRRVELVLVGSD